MQKILQDIDRLQKFVTENTLSKSIEAKMNEDFKLNYTYDSNAIEGNTLTLLETKIVLEGITIGGKSLREHFEVINHHNAIDYIYNLVIDKTLLSEYDIKSIHSLILKNIDDENAGKYRECNVKISGAMHIPPEHYEVPMQMQDFIQWYHQQAFSMHPVIRVSRMHSLFVGIHPFIDGNGRTGRLLMNLELLKSNLPAISIKSNKRLEYFKALDKAQTDKDYQDIDRIIADCVYQSLLQKEELILQFLQNKNNNLHKTNTIKRSR
ncbi:Fic family protein [Helicobacter anseris]|uniref:Fic family protein n=1 Tax=Helicobacter anseris TaxID=375926 RepID=A0A3D8JA41_9HELI|nr:Fic family protein [Helicobacter anseris]RDU74373.1 Fic family protein [Helicobacter anseris]